MLFFVEHVDNAASFFLAGVSAPLSLAYVFRLQSAELKEILVPKLAVPLGFSWAGYGPQNSPVYMMGPRIPFTYNEP
jgi:hypothetical protein